MIREIKWKNHPILGNLTLDFTKTDGTPYSTIVIAGENGTGKTTILETLSVFLSRGSIIPFEYIKYDANGTSFTIEPRPDGQHLELGWHIRKNESTNTEQTVNSSKNVNPEQIANDADDLRHYGCAYSKARSGFNTGKVQSVTTQQVDADKYEEDAKDDFTEIKQLLVDIDTQDNSAWMEITLSGVGTLFEDFRPTSKKYRFEQAFNNFFGAMQLKKVDHSVRGEMQILFTKNGKDINIDSLSTGEKQIVFRGAHLLKNSRNINGGIVLIDEPELSMHPKWQDKILKYYRDLFTQSGTQCTQMVFATHSEYVLRAALADPQNILVVVLNENGGNIQATKIDAPSVLPSITAAEINYIAFGIPSYDYHIALYGYLQTKVANHLGKASCNIQECDSYIQQQTTLYDAAKHEKQFSRTVNGRTVTEYTLPTYIRNAIDHPDSGRSFTREELDTSIELLIALCR